jgi:hypothetical protein
MHFHTVDVLSIRDPVSRHHHVAARASTRRSHWAGVGHIPAYWDVAMMKDYGWKLSMWSAKVVYVSAHLIGTWSASVIDRGSRSITDLAN